MATTTGYLDITEGTEPSAPSAGHQRLYVDSTTHLLMITNSGGTESAVGGVTSDATLTTTDITTNNSSTSKHGFLKKLDNNAAHFMDGTGAWSTPAGAGYTLATQAATSDTSLSAGTIADITGCTFSLAAGTWWISAEMYFDPGAGTTLGYVICEITDASNAILAIFRGFSSTLGTSNAVSVSLGNCPVVLGGTTTVKMRGLCQEAGTVSKNAASSSGPTTYMTAIKVA